MDGIQFGIYAMQFVFLCFCALALCGVRFQYCMFVFLFFSLFPSLSPCRFFPFFASPFFCSRILFNSIVRGVFVFAFGTLCVCVYASAFFLWFSHTWNVSFLCSLSLFVFLFRFCFAFIAQHCYIISNSIRTQRGKNLDSTRVPTESGPYVAMCYDDRESISFVTQYCCRDKVDANGPHHLTPHPNVLRIDWILHSFFRSFFFLLLK